MALRLAVRWAVVLVALAPSLAAAQGDTPRSPGECLLRNGLVYGPFRDGQSPDLGIYPSVAQVEEDLTFISQITRRIRIYGTTGPYASIPMLAAARGISVSQGIHLGADLEENERQIAAALRLAHAGLIDSIIVGNETLTASTLPKNELAGYIRRVRRDAPQHIPVSTGETWEKWSTNLDLAQDVDFVVAHFYPFWERHPIEGAAASLLGQYRLLQSQLRAEYPLRDFRIVVGETGWPSAGNPIADGVIPGPQNQQTFVQELMALACTESIPFYLFSVFDEEWKWQESASRRVDEREFPPDRTFSGKWIGSSWGLFQSNGILKPHLRRLFDQPDSGSRRDRDIFVGGQLAAYYDIGVETSHMQRDWLSTADESLKMSYPPGQEWGAVFVTVGTPVPMPRPWKDFWDFGILSFELKGDRGGETVEVGIKDSRAPDDGSERKVRLSDLSTEYRQYDIPLSMFASSRFVVPNDLQRLYVVIEFVFGGSAAQTVHARNIRYKPVK